MLKTDMYTLDFAASMRLGDSCSAVRVKTLGLVESWMMVIASGCGEQSSGKLEEQRNRGERHSITSGTEQNVAQLA